MRTLILVSVLIGFIGCSKNPERPTYTTISLPPGNGPWQIWTYDEEPVHFATVVFDGEDVSKVFHSVYINNSGQFTLRGGVPVKTVNGEHVYWSKTGALVTNRHNVIQRSSIFTLNSKPLDNETPLLLKEQLINAQANVER